MFKSNPIGFVLSLLLLGAIVFGNHVAHHSQGAAQFGFFYSCLASLAGFWMWRHSLRYTQLIDDIPTSKIVSAPQGYVELVGVAQAADNTPFVIGINGQDCLWRRLEIVGHEGSGGGSGALVAKVIDSLRKREESRTAFAIKDETGTATIFPYEAEIISTRKIVKYSEGTEYTEEYIVPGEPLYVLGGFSTSTPAEAPFDLLNETQAQVSIWQTDKKAMLQGFDKDGNGTLDMDEWETMHNAARKIAEQKHAALLAQPQVHTISNPGSGLRYLISSRPPEKLIGYYHLWRNVGLILFFGAGAAAVGSTGFLFS